MNYNVLSYIIYGVITVYIIYIVGKMFHKNGRVFILRLFNYNEPATDTTNNILLIAYYLFNIGYAIIQFSFWNRIDNVSQLLGSIAKRAGLLILILAVTHYCNMLLIYFLSKKNPSHIKI